MGVTQPWAGMKYGHVLQNDEPEQVSPRRQKPARKGGILCDSVSVK